MIEYAEEHEARFSADFPQAVFIRNLQDAYDGFLEEVEKEEMNASLEHPIARLFVDAEQHGVFDDSRSD